MAIEEGLVRLVQGNAAVLAICPVGGFLSEEPKDEQLPSWMYKFLGESPTYTQAVGETGFVSPAIVEIRCFASDGATVVSLSRAINAVLSGFRGTLPDSDQTVVNGCFRIEHGPDGPFDDFSATRRIPTRTLYYELHYGPQQ